MLTESTWAIITLWILLGSFGLNIIFIRRINRLTQKLSQSEGAADFYFERIVAPLLKANGISVAKKKNWVKTPQDAVVANQIENGHIKTIEQLIDGDDE